MTATSRTTGPIMSKRAVNLSLNEGQVEQAKTYTNNLSATMDDPLAAYVTQQDQIRLTRQQQADEASMDWNAVQAALGSFADEHSTL